MKKKVLIIAALAICLSLLASGTLAYFTSESTAKNVITAGGINIAVEEFQNVDGQLVPYPAEPIAIMPGAVVSKIPQVKNNEDEAWIRARYTITVKDAEGEVMELTEAELANVMSLTMGADWINRDPADGWLYFKSSVKTGESTTPIFTAVNFDGPNMGNEFQHCTVEIDIQAQAVQTANNGATVLEAAGWPAE